jgi:hypothetical protein
MRAHTITTMSRRRRRARRRAIALALAVCSLAIPASVSAQPIEYLTPNATTGGSDQSSQPSGGSDQSSVNAITGGSSTSNVPTGSGSSPDVAPEYASPNAIAGAEPLTIASGSPSGADQWFDVPSALLGAGSAMALVALGGAAFLTVRRQREVSPSASTS